MSELAWNDINWTLVQDRISRQQLICESFHLEQTSGNAAWARYAKLLFPLEDKDVEIGDGESLTSDEGSSFEYTEKRAQDVEERLIPLLQAKDSPYKRFIMRVPGFGNNRNSFNSFIIIALLDDWADRKKSSQTVMREAIGKIVTVPETVAFPISPQSIRVSSYNKPVQMVILGSTYEELEEIQSKVINKLRQNKNFKGFQIKLDNKTHTLKLSQLADDITLFLNSKQEVSLTLNIIEIFWNTFRPKA